VVRGYGGDARTVRAGHGEAAGPQVHVAELPAVVQPEPDAQQYHALDEHAQDGEQLYGNTVAGRRAPSVHDRHPGGQVTVDG